jgi:hypothetical protein
MFEPIIASGEFELGRYEWFVVRRANPQWLSR